MRLEQSNHQDAKDRLEAHPLLRLSLLLMVVDILLLVHPLVFRRLPLQDNKLLLQQWQPIGF